ncbi:hypothetical protein PLESTM_000768600 [Pleodorina starrii]|nr:hypothetical protein PLESTM_000768600 [Pleodorina starrii]
MLRPRAAARRATTTPPAPGPGRLPAGGQRSTVQSVPPRQASLDSSEASSRSARRSIPDGVVGHQTGHPQASADADAAAAAVPWG